MSDTNEVVWQGWVWRAFDGWVAVESARGSYCDAWAALRATEPCLNGRVQVLRAGEQPHEEPRTQRK